MTKLKHTHRKVDCPYDLEVLVLVFNESMEVVAQTSYTDSVWPVRVSGVGAFLDVNFTNMKSKDIGICFQMLNQITDMF